MLSKQFIVVRFGFFIYLYTLKKDGGICLMRYLHLKTTLGTALRPHNGYNYNI